MLMSYENDRRNLANRAHEVLGKDEGETLLEHLPHGGYSHMATKQDLQVLSTELRKEIADAACLQVVVLFGLISVVNGIFFFPLSVRG
ncbi:MAG: hypothetical protein ACKODP_02585, partial [Actinomycetota bacterium]